MPINLGAAAGAGVSGLFGLIGAGRRQKRQHDYNMQLADYNYDRQYQMWDEAWNRQTAYNDPSAQMARYKNAGINPHLAYSQGGSPGTADPGTLPEYKQEGLNVRPSVAEGLSGIFQKYFMHKQMILDTKKKEAETKREEIKSILEGTNLQDKILAESYGANSKASKEISDYLFKHMKDSVTHLSKYDETLDIEFKMKRLQKDLTKANALLTAEKAKEQVDKSWITNMQAQLMQGQVGFVKSEEFKKLPGVLQAIILGIAKQLGGM